MYRNEKDLKSHQDLYELEKKMGEAWIVEADEYWDYANGSAFSLFR